MTAPTCCSSTCSQGRNCPLRQSEITARTSSIGATLIAAALLVIVCLYAVVQHQDTVDAERLTQQIAERK